MAAWMGKERVSKEIEAIFPDIWEINRWLYENPELPGEEKRAVQRLSAYLKKQGFRVEEGTAGLETAFTAVYKVGEGGPRVGFLAEYDALPEVGHGCGHNIIAASCIGAAVALSRVLKKPAEIVVFGTPDEEYDGGKIYMAEAGVFSGMDAVMQTHILPDGTYVGGSSTPHQALVISFHGKAAHTAFNPTEGINALNALIITFNGLNALQQSLKPGTRIPATITNGGGAPNVVPKFTQMRIHVTTLEPDYLAEVVSKIENCAQAGGTATGAQVEVWKGPLYKKLYTNDTLTRILRKNVEAQGYKTEEPPPARMATDVGNVSWECPTTMCHLSLESPGLPMHSRELADATVSPKGEKMLMAAAKSMAAAALEVITDPLLLQAVRKDYGAGP